MAMKDYNSAHLSLNQFIKYASFYGFNKFKLEAELIHCQLYIDLGDLSSAMILITKTIASLNENNDGNFGKIKLMS